MKHAFIVISLLCVLLTGCQTKADDSTQMLVTPYETRTAVVPLVPTLNPTLEPPPASTLPTQITHVVQKGEDMGGIATKYGVKIKDLREANSKIDPRMIPIGTVLIIPSGNPEQDANQPTAIPTPAVVLLTGMPLCYPDPSGGAWCLIKVENNTPASVEDVSIDIVLSGSDESEPVTMPSFGLLDRLPAGSSTILAAYIPETPAQPWQVNTRLRTANPVIREDERYLMSSLENTSTQISTNGLSARVSGSAQLKADQKDANVIQVTACAYDASGLPVGVRRWDSPVGLESGSGLMYDFYVYSLNGPIDRVDVLVETRP